MTYKKSLARKQFETQVSESNKQLKQIVLTLHTNSVSSEVLLGAYYVFSFALLEVYMKSVFDDAIGLVMSKSPPMHIWPTEMLGYFVHKGANLGDTYQKYFRSDNECQLLTQIGVITADIGSWAQTGNAKKTLSSQMVLDRRTYPSHNNIPKLLSRVGISNCWARL